MRNCLDGICDEEPLDGRQRDEEPLDNVMRGQREESASLVCELCSNRGLYIELGNCESRWSELGVD